MDLKKVIFVMILVCAALLPCAAHCGDVVGSDELVRQLSQPKKSLTRGFVVGKAAPRPSATIYIYFATNSADITGEASLQQLDELGQALTSKELAGARVEIGGHTDSVGAEAYNMTLSQRRADAVAAYLDRKYGVRDVVATGYGESEPVTSNDTEEGRAKNRRVVITRIN